jgi:hypothetical protein
MGAECAATIRPEDLPRSWRGLDAIDRLAWMGGRTPPAGANDDQRLAIARWRRLRQDVAFVAPAVRAPEAQSSSSRHVLLIAYPAALIAIALVLAPLGRHVWRVYATLGVVIAAGVAAALADGRIGPGSAIDIVEAVVIRTGEGWPGALVSTRGTVRVPAFGPMELRAASEDIVLHVRGGAPGEAVRQLEDGTSVLGGRFAKGARIEYEGEGFIENGFLEVARADGTIRLTNRSGSMLSDCTVPPGLSPQKIARFAEGTTIELRGAPRYEGPELTCTVMAPAPSLTAAGRVERRAAAMLSFALGS